MSSFVDSHNYFLKIPKKEEQSSYHRGKVSRHDEKTSKKTKDIADKQFGEEAHPFIFPGDEERALKLNKQNSNSNSTLSPKGAVNNRFL